MKIKVGQTDIVLERGDVTDAEVDAIVYPANTELVMGAGVAGAIKRKGGTIIEEDAMRQGPLEVGEVVVTTAGNLAANYVIHAAVMGPDLRSGPDLVRRATLAALRRAEDLRLGSVAMPAFGIGVGRMAPKDAALAMVDAFRAHLTEVTPSTLRRLHVVVFQEDAYQEFSACLGLSGTRRAG